MRRGSARTIGCVVLLAMLAAACGQLPAVHRSPSRPVIGPAVHGIAAGPLAGRPHADAHVSPAHAITTVRARLAPAPRAARPSRAKGRTELLADVSHAMPIRARPGAGPVVGTMPAASRYYRRPTVAWVMRLADHGRFGEVPVPYVAGNRAGWIDLRGLRVTRSGIEVAVELSRHLVEVERRGRIVLTFPAATGSPATPTPTGRYFVTDRVPFPATSEYGAFAFGISGIQPDLPPGWTGGDQLAIHGTNDPASIGSSVSTGCIRVSAGALHRLEPLLAPGTPVVIRP